MTHAGHATTIGMRSHRIPVTWYTPYLIATWDNCRKTNWDGLIDRLVAHRYVLDPIPVYISAEAAILMFNPSAVVKPTVVQENDTWWK